LYHEKRIALVYNFVCLLPLKNIVQGRKGLLKVKKEIPWESSFTLFYPWDGKVKSAHDFTCRGDRKVEKNYPRVFSFPPSNILLFPRQYCSVGVGNGNFSPLKFSIS
jgi:hypothetical protein